MNPPVGQPASPKILSHEQLLRARQRARHEGKRLVHCHGCFDLVHPGHIRHLRFAKAQGDLLLVSITGDDQINKGTGRPLIPEELRADNLAALDPVDFVYIERRSTAQELLGEVRPDVYVKGKEYENNHDPRFHAERQAVEQHGGRVVFSSGDVVFSSTALIAAMEASVDPYHDRLATLMRREDLAGEALFPLLAAVRGTRLLVVGETILDTYVLCDRPEVASESPVMTLRPVERRQYLGGAAVLARHAAALGARPTLLTTLPEDGPQAELADQVRQQLLAEGVELVTQPQAVPVAEKQRFLVGSHKVMKVDLLEPNVLDASAQDRFVGLATELSERADAAIVADFGLGLFTRSLLGQLIDAIRPRTGVLSGDVSGRRASLTLMRDMDLLCPSETELREALHRYDEGLPLAAWQLLERTGARSALVTLGAEGLIAFDRLENPAETGGGWATRLRSEHVPALNPLAVDPLGCGDALLTTATLALAAGGTIVQSALLGASAAGVHAQRLGNMPVSATDVRHALARLHASHLAYADADVIRSRAVPTPGQARTVA